MEPVKVEETFLSTEYEHTRQPHESERDSARQKKNGRYSFIDNDRREKLISLVKKQKMTLSQAAKVCEINKSTAKGILKVYEREGRIGKKLKYDTKYIVVNHIIITNSMPFSKTPYFSANQLPMQHLIPIQQGASILPESFLLTNYLNLLQKEEAPGKQ